ncbi:MAG: DUF4012 domain-containing protein, partial [bacterium]|nr:DUF4012 domain-containing protein [bacterium]
YLLLFRANDNLYEEAAGFAKSLAAQTHEIPATILNLGRLYGPGIPYEESGALGYLVKEFAEKDFLTVYGDGKDQDYYLYAQDAAIGVGQALKGALPGPIVSLTSPVPVSSESIAKLLFDLGGGRHEIHYHRGIAADDEKGKIEGVPLPKFKTTTAFNDGVLAKLKEDSPSLKPKGPLFHLPPITFKRQERKEKAPARKLTLPKLKIPVAILAAILLPLLYLGLEIGWVAFNFNRAKTELSSLDFPGAQKSLANSAGSLRRLGVIVPPLKIAADLADTVSDVLPPANALSQALENLQKSYQGEAVTPQTENEFKDLSRALNSASQELSIAWLALQDLHPFWSPLSERGEKLIQEDALPALSLLSALADQGYDVLGYKGERSYLLLFQNSAELQPGGGRMGTFANLTLLSGGVKSLKFYNESDYKHISSPLGQFNAISKFPDFRDGARAIADIFARGNGTTTQGVVGVDLRIAQELLSVTGPLTLADFDNQEITAENFFEVTTREVETDFFPGTTKKKRFIQALGEGVLNQLFRTKDYGSISRLVWEGLKEKRLMLYFTKSALYLPAL